MEVIVLSFILGVIITLGLMINNQLGIIIDILKQKKE